MIRKVKIFVKEILSIIVDNYYHIMWKEDKINFFVREPFRLIRVISFNGGW